MTNEDYRNVSPQDPEETASSRPRISPQASLALVLALGLALWGMIFLLA